ncbi:urease subunit beta [Microtetraspora malaysiensis]|uniref:urease subunit beta n=1 Tax=Microtetraspora malaysiensis TaxID=161358 RepID=UPI003D934B74
MRLTPHEQERLLIHVAAGVARDRRERGLADRGDLPRRHQARHRPPADRMIPGEIVYGDAPVPLNPGRRRITLRVVNTADRPIQVGSHYHFAAAPQRVDR